MSAAAMRATPNDDDCDSLTAALTDGEAEHVAILAVEDDGAVDQAEGPPSSVKSAKPKRKRNPQPTYEDGARTRVFKFPSRTYPKSSYYVTGTEIIIRIRKARKRWKLILPKKRVVSYKTNRWFAKPRWVEVELTYTQALKFGLVEAWTPPAVADVAAPDVTAPDAAAPDAAAPDGALPAVADQTATEPDPVVTTDVFPGEAVPGEAVPGEARPDETLAAGAVPVPFDSPTDHTPWPEYVETDDRLATPTGIGLEGETDDPVEPTESAALEGPDPTGDDAPRLDQMWDDQLDSDPFSPDTPRDVIEAAPQISPAVEITEIEAASVDAVGLTGIATARDPEPTSRSVDDTAGSDGTFGDDDLRHRISSGDCSITEFLCDDDANEPLFAAGPVLSPGHNVEGTSSADVLIGAAMPEPVSEPSHPAEATRAIDDGVESDDDAVATGRSPNAEMEAAQPTAPPIGETSAGANLTESDGTAAAPAIPAPPRRRGKSVWLEAALLSLFLAICASPLWRHPDAAGDDNPAEVAERTPADAPTSVASAPDSPADTIATGSIEIGGPATWPIASEPVARPVEPELPPKREAAPIGTAVAVAAPPIGPSEMEPKSVIEAPPAEPMHADARPIAAAGSTTVPDTEEHPATEAVDARAATAEAVARLATAMQQLPTEQLPTGQLPTGQAPIAPRPSERPAPEQQAALLDVGPSPDAGVRCRVRAVDAAGSMSVRFAFASASLPQPAVESLDRLATSLAACRTVRMTIEGHTDSDGHFDRNQRLSLRRADEVRRYLMSAGVAPDQLSVVGFGQTRPLVPNDSSTNKRRNRRIEFVVQ